MVDRRTGTTPSAQLELLEPVAPKLTERQQFTLRLVEEAADGVTADEAGAAWCAQRGRHPVETRCDNCGRNGQQVLESLKKKGLVRYRRRTNQTPGAWLAVSARDAPRVSAVPYGEFPPGF